MKLILLSLLLTAPAIAQSIDPLVFGERYCYLRQLGVDEDAARKAAVQHSWLPNRSTVFTKADTMQAAKYIVENCPSRSGI